MTEMRIVCLFVASLLFLTPSFFAVVVKGALLKGSSCGNLKLISPINTAP